MTFKLCIARMHVIFSVAFHHSPLGGYGWTDAVSFPGSGKELIAAWLYRCSFKIGLIVIVLGDGSRKDVEKKSDFVKVLCRI